MMRNNKGLAALAAIAFVTACTHATSTPPVTVPAPTATAMANTTSLAVRWFRRSAEQRAIYIQAFRLAKLRLNQTAQGLAPNTFAVITDADETILDNSIFQEEQERAGASYSEAAWEAYVARQVATALPGAVDFVDHVHSLGGRVVVVTNRADKQCEITRQNIAKVGLKVDEVLCRPAPPASSDKNPRFKSVQDRYRVLLFVGDNIQDFPATTQAIRSQGDSSFEHFGVDWIVMPNPMYGSWERNP